MAAISEVYQRDVNVRLVVPFLRTFSSNVDPYNGSQIDPTDVVAHGATHLHSVGPDGKIVYTGRRSWKFEGLTRAATTSRRGSASRSPYCT